MSLKMTIRALACYLALFALTGCSNSPIEENAECSQGAAREEKCGLYGVGLQQQVCGPRFRWINEGACVEQTVCEHRETRRESCDGLNGNAYREQRCDLGQWPDTWGACTEPDKCVNDDVSDEICVGEYGGFNGRARRDLVCILGQWASSSDCVDPDFCTVGDVNPDECGANELCVFHDDIYACACREHFVEDDEGICYLPPVCDDGETASETCEGNDGGLNGRAERPLICEEGQWAVAGECLDSDECTVNGTDCHADATCQNEADPASYICQCDAGFVGDGQTCTNVNECADPDLNTCSDLALCTDTPGSFSCDCFPGTVDVDGDGKTCNKFVSFSLGANHTCGVTGDSEIYCWGRNDVGQLGDGTTTPSSRPIRLSTETHWHRIAAGGNYTRALNRVIEFVYWGGDSADAILPAYNVGPVMTTLDNFIAEEISVGSTHTCALTSSPSELYCWGYNDHGQLGDKTTVAKSSPRRVPNIQTSNWSSISAGGRHTCGMTNWAEFYCWGAGDKGQLGNMTYTGSTTPVPVASTGLSLTKIETGENHNCAVANYFGQHQLYCWGDNAKGQLGVGGYSRRNAPTVVGGGIEWSQVAPGRSHTCAISLSSQLYCWGANDKGQLGIANPSVTDSPTPILVSGSNQWRKVHAGGDHTCALYGGAGGNDLSFLYCWGANESGQVGQSASSSVNAPTAIAVD